MAQSPFFLTASVSDINCAGENTCWKHALNKDTSLTEYIHLKQKSKLTIRTLRYFSLKWSSQHCDPKKGLNHLTCTLWFSLPLLPALCLFQVPVPPELWGSRCLVTVYLEIRSTRPLGWNPLACVRREIVLLKGQRFSLPAEGNCGVKHMINASGMKKEPASFQSLLHLLFLWLLTDH